VRHRRARLSRRRDQRTRRVVIRDAPRRAGRMPQPLALVRHDVPDDCTRDFAFTSGGNGSGTGARFFA